MPSAENALPNEVGKIIVEKVMQEMRWGLGYDETDTTSDALILAALLRCRGDRYEALAELHVRIR